MRKFLQLILLVILTSAIEAIAQTPSWSWAKSAGGTNLDAGFAISTDANGNVFVAGNFFSSSITFGSTTLNDAGLADVFVVKYDASGNVLWAKRAGGTDYDAATAISTDTSGNVIITGRFASSSISFGSTTLTNTNPGFNDFFVVKYDASGNVLWATSTGGTEDDSGGGISTEADGNVIVTGRFKSSSITFGSTTLTNANMGIYDMCVVKYSPSGNVLWAKGAGGTEYDAGSGISIDTVGNVFVTGTFLSPSITFGSTTLTNAGNSNMYVVKYSPSGNVLWAKCAGGTGSRTGIGISTDATGNAFVTGYFSSPSITFDSITLTNAGFPDFYVVKYDSSGNVLWATSAGGIEDDAGYGISTDKDGNVFVSGNFSSSSIDFGSTTLTNTFATLSDIFVVKYSSSGNVLWAISAGGTDEDGESWICTDAEGNAVVTGFFSSPSFTLGSTTLTNAGNRDIFVAKLENTTGIEENIKSNVLSIFPNPFYNTTIVSFSISKTEKVSVRILDMNGRIIETLADKIIFEAGDHQIKFNAEKLNAGIYFLKMETGEFLKSEKLIVTK